MRPLENKSIAFWLSVSLIFGLGGCSDSGSAPNHNGLAPTETSDGEVELPKVQISTLEVPNTEDLGIIHNGERLRLGDLREIGLDVFSVPTRAQMFREELPVLNDSMKAEAWEDGARSFGLITQKGRIALAIYTEDKVTENRINDVVADHERAFGSAAVTVSGNNVNYRFWSRGSARVMICDATDWKQKRSVSIAVGHFELMDVLRMSAKAAEQDHNAAEVQLGKVWSTGRDKLPK